MDALFFVLKILFMAFIVVLSAVLVYDMLYNLFAQQTAAKKFISGFFLGMVLYISALSIITLYAGG